MSLRAALAPVALLVACAAPSTAAGAPWSAPVDLGPPADYVLAPAVAFTHTGLGLLTWQRRAQPALAGGLPGATSVIVKQRNDGVVSRALALGLPGATVQATADSIAAGPVFEDGGRGLVLRTLSLSPDGDGNRRRRLSWSAVSGAGRIGRAHTIATATLGADPSLAEDHRGNAIAAWSEYSPTSAKSDVGTYRIRAAWRPAGRAFGTPVTLYRTDAPGYARNGAVTAAIGREGRAVIAFADLQIRKRRDLKRVLVWSRTPRRGFAGPQAIGTHSDAADFALAVTDRGRIFVGWGTQDGGEEANTPWILRVASRRPGAARFGAARVLDRGASSRLRPPDGAVRLVADPEGHATLAWTAVRPGATYPVLVATSDAGGHFGAMQQVAPAGVLGGLAMRQDGTAILTYARIASTSPFGDMGTDQVFAVLRPRLSALFGAPEAIAGPDHALAPVVAFDQRSGRPTAAWPARPRGADPSTGITTTAVLRVATRDAP
jgi:hypothetical protein